MNEFDIIEKTFSWLDDFKSSRVYLAYKSKEQEMLNHPEVTSLLENYEHKKQKYEEAKPMKDHFPGFKEILNDFIKAKDELYLHPVYQAYLAQLRELNGDLKVVTDQLNDILSSVYINTGASCTKKV
ncbi:MAG: YlbF family regulator [Candidatus Izemoplasmatales bacterium]